MDSDSDDEIILLQSVASAINFEMIMASQLSDVFDSDKTAVREKCDFTCGPGRGNAIIGMKAQYERSKGVAEAFYMSVKRSHNPEMWNNFTGCTEEKLDEIFSIGEAELRKPFNVRNEFTEEDNLTRTPQRRGTSEEVMFFIFCHVLRGGNEGGIGLRTASHLYGLSEGTMSNYLRHVAWALFKSLKGNGLSKIEWTSSA